MQSSSCSNTRLLCNRVLKKESGVSLIKESECWSFPWPAQVVMLISRKKKRKRRREVNASLGVRSVLVDGRFFRVAET